MIKSGGAGINFLYLSLLEQRKKNKSNQIQLIAIKITIALLAIWFIYRRVFEKENFTSLAGDFKSILLQSSGLLLLTVIFLLMLLNWSVEAVKWKMMISKIQDVTFFKSLEAVFSGLTISFFTPNRIGEYAGRVFHLKSADRIKATLITVIENLSQLLITVIAGSIALIFYLVIFVSSNPYVLITASVLVIVFITASILFFLNVSFLQSLFSKWKFSQSWKKYTEVFGYYTYAELLRVIFLAAIRYFIFTMQFYLLLNLFGVQTGFPVTFLLISLTYFVMTLVPTIALTELGVRGAVAVFFLGRITDHHAAIVSATVSLWIINLVIPALIGTIFVFMFNLGNAKKV
jgi:uncharacterized membrane protein YbhN (UPF0104 family)